MKKSKVIDIKFPKIFIFIAFFLVFAVPTFAQKIRLESYINKKLVKKQKLIFSPASIKKQINKQLKILYNQGYLKAQLDSLKYGSYGGKIYYSSQNKFGLNIKISNYDSLNIIKSIYSLKKKIILRE